MKISKATNFMSQLLITNLPRLTLESPNPDQDAPFALEWFRSDYGLDTLLKMGNTPDEISKPTLEGERQTIQEFIELEKQGKQITWMMRYDNQTIGAIWVELTENYGVKPPSIHLMIGDKSFRGRGVGTAAMTRVIEYLKAQGYEKIYSRHLSSNSAVSGLNRKLGFVVDGEPYTDNNGLNWQNIYLSL